VEQEGRRLLIIKLEKEKKGYYRQKTCLLPRLNAGRPGLHRGGRGDGSTRKGGVTLRGGGGRSTGGVRVSGGRDTRVRPWTPTKKNISEKGETKTSSRGKSWGGGGRDGACTWGRGENHPAVGWRTKKTTGGGGLRKKRRAKDEDSFFTEKKLRKGTRGGLGVKNIE